MAMPAARLPAARLSDARRRAPAASSGSRTAIAPRVEDDAADHEALRRKADQVSRGSVRAAVLGANDGLVSNLSLILGVAGADASQSAVRLAGFASLVAGAFSMAAGEWVSVRAQVELFRGVLLELRRLLSRNPTLVLTTIAERLEAIGLDTSTARQASTELGLDEDRMLDFAARNVMGVNPDELGSPVTAALSSLVLFAGGALVPLLPWFFTSGTTGAVLSALLTLVAALAVGVVIGRSSGGSVIRSLLRQAAIVIGASAMTYAVGKLFGTVVG